MRESEREEKKSWLALPDSTRRRLFGTSTWTEHTDTQGLDGHEVRPDGQPTASRT